MSDIYIDSTQNSVARNPLLERQSEGGSDAPLREQGTENTSTAGADFNKGISLAELSPQTRAALQKIVDQGGDVQKNLQKNIEILQDDFLAALNDKMNNAGIAGNEKLTLRLEGNDSLSMTGEHPQKDEINAILEESPELAGAFKEIAAQSSLVRDIRSIRTLASTHAGISAYGDMMATAPSSAYQVSIKGDMSHFYFSPTR